MMNEFNPSPPIIGSRDRFKDPNKRRRYIRAGAFVTAGITLAAITYSGDGDKQKLATPEFNLPTQPGASSDADIGCTGRQTVYTGKNNVPTTASEIIDSPIVIGDEVNPQEAFDNMRKDNEKVNLLIMPEGTKLILRQNCTVEPN